MANRRNILIGCLLGLLAALAALSLNATPVLERFENYTWDLRVRALAEPADVPVKLIVLDQQSLDWGERSRMKFPWPRDVYENYLLSFCRRAGVKAVAFDMYMTEADALDKAADDELAAGIARTPRFVGAVVTSSKVGEVERWPAEAPPSPFRVENLDLWLSERPDAEIAVARATFSTEVITRATKALGHVRGAIDIDNVIRRCYPVQTFDGQVIPMLGVSPFAMTAAEPGADAAPGKPPAMRMEGDALVIGDRRIVLDRGGRAILNFYRPRSDTIYSFEAYSVGDVMASEDAIQNGEKPKLPPEIFKDCYVIFGFSAPGLYDIQPTPFSKETKATPGVEIHATMLANLITGQLMAPAAPLTVTVFTLLWSALVGALTARGGKAWWLAIVSLVAVTVPVALGVVGYRSLVWWPIMSPLLASGLAVTAGIVYIYNTEARKRRYIHAAFGRYLSPKVVDQLVANPKLLDLGGIDKELSIFFSDMEHFSKISEVLGARRVTTLLNVVLSEISQVIRDEDGTLDKYVGDAVVAFWNAPTDQPDHAVRAVRAALRCQRRMKEREAEFRELAGGHTVRIRIGLHIGEVVVGNLGSKYLMNYSMMGDAANLASRLEGANKAFGTMILCSHELWSKTGDQFFGRQLGTVTVVGRDTPVQIIEPLGEVGDALPPGLSRFARALALSHEGLIDEAIAVLQTLHDDPVAQAYVSYLRGLDPAMRWDGVWRLSAK